VLNTTTSYSSASLSLSPSSYSFSSSPKHLVEKKGKDERDVCRSGVLSTELSLRLHMDNRNSKVSQLCSARFPARRQK